ncbi:MAG: hypothetical protein KGD63_06255 [Candidatus Lokiarchaeota archaeon]|nr:hypothetical protein [Candidatus Lokiarchaeota archaeon]
MPTIEIISVRNENRLNFNQKDYSLAILEDSNLISHRGLFQNFLDRYIGTIIHLGNPDMKFESEFGFFAGMIIDWNFKPEKDIIEKNKKYYFKFLPNFKNEINRLLIIAKAKSPINTIFFLTDYQFGPKKKEIKIKEIDYFWKIHDDVGLRFNTIYIIQ